MTHGTTVFLSCRVTVFLVMSSSRYSCHVERPTGVETSLHTSALKISPLTVLLPQAARCKSPPDCLLVARDSRNDKWSDGFSCHVERPQGVETSLHMPALKISPLTVLLPQAARCKSPPDCLLVARDSRNDKWSDGRNDRMEGQSK